MHSFTQTIHCRFFQRAFFWCVPIGGLGGLIGLGGGEFRLPVLMYAIGFDARSSIPLNLIISFVTLAISAIARSHFIPTTAIIPRLPELAGLAGGGMISASFGASFVHRIADRRLVQVIGALLAALGVLLLIEVVRPFEHTILIASQPELRLCVGFAIGIAVGLVSSLLCVAGGELLIPTLIFIFDTDIRVAGSAGILVSLALVLSGLWRYWRLGAIPSGGGVPRIAAAMSAGSVLGAVVGGLAVAYAPVGVLKVVLGGLLMATAGKTIASQRRGRS
jgi:uncharacterized membrane protein YfcA